MRLMIDTARDNPRLIRAAVAMVLASLDNGDALPVGIPAGTILSPNEQRPPAPSIAVAAAPAIAPDQAAAAAFGSQPPPGSQPPAPPPAPPAAAPSAPVPPGNPAGAVERDSEGLPWDSRIHSGSRAKVANGTWKLAKGMSLQKTKVEQVKAELRAVMAIPAVPLPPAVALADSIPLAPPPPPPAAAPAAPPPAPPAPVATAPAGDPATFPAFMQWVAGLITEGKWNHTQTTAALSSLGLPNAIALSARPDLIPSAVATIRAMLPA